MLDPDRYFGSVGMANKDETPKAEPVVKIRLASGCVVYRPARWGNGPPHPTPPAADTARYRPRNRRGGGGGA